MLGPPDIVLSGWDDESSEWALENAGIVKNLQEIVLKCDVLFSSFWFLEVRWNP